MNVIELEMVHAEVWKLENAKLRGTGTSGMPAVLHEIAALCSCHSTSFYQRNSQHPEYTHTDLADICKLFLEMPKKTSVSCEIVRSDSLLHLSSACACNSGETPIAKM
ncbi:hypothetical protein KQX54_005067 [Cotesia glomerata]|uniref:Uncharacterized protein n=1 Tax=Cotesia glomerata TaxID=32391 RepID=A0AAV7HUX5_COTGL|nr:hypothetical protein KQX54_005067 [Cotesia glomerata]